MSTVFVKPIEGVAVQYPGTMTVMPAAGAEVPVDGSREGVYWQRRINDGSVVVAPKEEKAVEQPTASEPAGTSQKRERRII